MPRRIRKKQSLLAPAGSLIRRLSDTDARLRRRFVRIGLWVIAGIFVYSLMSGTYGIPRIIRLKMTKEALIETNRRQTVQLVDAVRLRDHLLSDPDFIEQIARTRYHMVRPNEILYRYRGQ